MIRICDFDMKDSGTGKSIQSRWGNSRKVETANYLIMTATWMIARRFVYRFSKREKRTSCRATCMLRGTACLQI